MGFVIHWHESAMDLHVFPLPIPPPTSPSTWSIWVFPVHQARALVSCIQPGLVICFTLDNIHASMLFSWNIPPLPSPTESKSLFCTSVSLFMFFFFLVFTCMSSCISWYSVQFSLVAQSCQTFWDPINCSMPGLPVRQQLLEFTQTHIHRVGDAIQPSHLLSSPSPPASNPSQQQGLLQRVNSSNEVAKVLEFQLQHQSFQWQS